MPQPIAFTCQPFETLSAQQFFDISYARVKVFVVEQHCPYQEIDALDPQSFHLQGWVTDADGHRTLAAYARIIPPALAGELPRIGRVIVVEAQRHQGYATKLMNTAIAFCHTQYPNQAIAISAQTYLLDFYQSLGFVPQGEPYLEDDIPHIDMLLG